MGTTAYGGKGSKGRAANGDRPVGAASCRRDHHTMASCQNPPLLPPNTEALCQTPPPPSRAPSAIAAEPRHASTGRPGAATAFYMPCSLILPFLVSHLR